MKDNRIVSGAFTQSLPVPRMKPASVLPMPVANSPKAPAVQVWLSVPKRTSPAGCGLLSGKAMWQTPLYPACRHRKVFDVLLGRKMTQTSTLRLAILSAVKI